MDSILAAFAECVKCGVNPLDDTAQALVKKWQAYITENYYTSTKEILFGLGEMYIADERFKRNLDKHGAGTAEFVAAAIKYYCQGDKV